MAAPTTPRFQGILEGDEVQRFFETVIPPREVRDQLPPDVAQRMPSSMEDVLATTREIWNERGLLSPAELRAELLERTLAHAPQEVRDTIRQIELSRNTPEATTGYLSKEHAYLASGLSHMYARETGRPVAMAEVDFSNMGGTNEEFIRRIAAERGIPPEQISKREAEALTDLAVRVLSGNMTEQLAENLPEGVRIHPIRTGGDELRLVFDGVDDPKKLQEIEDILHATVERSVARMGLQDHPHLKDPANPVRNGFGAALTVADMRDIRNPETLIQSLDERIKHNKETLGAARIGEVDQDAIVRELTQAIDSGTLQVPAGSSREEVIEQHLSERMQRAQWVAHGLHQENPLHNSDVPRQGISGFKAFCEQEIARMEARGTPIVSENLPKPLEGDLPIGSNRPEGVGPMDSPARRRYAIIEQHLTGRGVPLDPAAQFYLRQSVSLLTPTDPSAQVQMPRDMVRLAEAYAGEVEEYRQQFSPDDPAVQDALARAGFSSLDDVKPQAMAVSLHGLASANNALGHHNADLFLRHVGGEIIDTAFRDAGLPHDARTPYVVAHHGGGNFSILSRPGIVGADGTPTFISPQMMEQVSHNITEQIAELNRTGIRPFLEQRGIETTPEMDEYLKNEKIETFGDMRDSKMREAKMPDGTVIEGRINGLMVTSVAASIDPAAAGEFNGGRFIGSLRQTADAQMDDLRTDRVLRDYDPSLRPPAAEGHSSPTDAMDDTVRVGPVGATVRDTVDAFIPTTKGGVAITAAVALGFGAVKAAEAGDLQDGVDAGIGVLNPLQLTFDQYRKDGKFTPGVATQGAKDIAGAAGGVAGGMVAGGAAGAVFGPVGAVGGALVGGFVGAQAVDAVTSESSAIYQGAVSAVSDGLFALHEAFNKVSGKPTVAEMLAPTPLPAPAVPAAAEEQTIDMSPLQTATTAQNSQGKAREPEAAAPEGEQQPPPDGQKRRPPTLDTGLNAL